jgi:hypothetical protein
MKQLNIFTSRASCDALGNIDIDNAMEVLEAMEAKNKNAASASTPSQGRILIGNVDKFFNKINVAAITLTGTLAIGDTMEIESEEYTLRQKVSSMQIDRKDVIEAYDGDDVGIKLSVPVPEGSKVYKLG